MLMIKAIMSQVQEGDWFVTIDLKDAYFTSRSFKDTRGSFGLPLEGRLTNTRSCPSAWLGAENIYEIHGCCTGPFEAPGHSCTELSGRLAHSGSLQGASESSQGYRSRPHPFSWPQEQRQEECAPPISANQVRLDSVQLQARLAPARIPDLTACLARFKLGHHVSVGACRRLLGLMAAASPVLPLGLLHMRPFLWWMKELRLHPTVPATRLIRVSHSCCRPLLMWRDPVFLHSAVTMGAIHRHHMITTDASMTGWGAFFEGRPASREWKEEFLFWHINCLELRAVLLALMYFLPVLRGYHIIVRMDNMAVVPHKPPRRFTVAHPGQACTPFSPLVPRQVPLFEGGSRSGSTEPGGRFSVETEAQAGGMDVEPSDGIPDLGSVWQSGGGPLCFSRVIPVPALVLPEFPDDSGHRCEECRWA